MTGNEIHSLRSAGTRRSQLARREIAAERSEIAATRTPQQLRWDYEGAVNTGEFAQAIRIAKRIAATEPEWADEWLERADDLRDQAIALGYKDV